jgi:transposase
MIESVTGVHYHAGHVWRVMKDLGWSLQRPAVRAKERDERAIERRKRTTGELVEKETKRRGPG